MVHNLEFGVQTSNQLIVDPGLHAPRLTQGIVFGPQLGLSLLLLRTFLQQTALLQQRFWIIDLLQAIGYPRLLLLGDASVANDHTDGPVASLLACERGWDGSLRFHLHFHFLGFINHSYDGGLRRRLDTNGRYFHLSREGSLGEESRTTINRATLLIFHRLAVLGTLVEEFPGLGIGLLGEVLGL